MEKAFAASPTEIAAEIQRIEAEFPWLILLSPTNQKEQKALFLKGRIEEPTFTYKTTDIPRLHMDIKKEGPLTSLYEERLRFCEGITSLLSRPGDKEFAATSLALFPFQELDTMQLAYESQPYGGEELSTKAIMEAFRGALADCGLHECEVRTVSDITASILTVDGAIVVRAGFRMPEEELEYTIRHELAHMLRRENGEKQPEPLLHIGTAEGRRIEEGVAVALEKPKDISYAVDLYQSVKFAIAHTFRKTYAYLVDAGKSEDDAWGLALRAKRGLEKGSSKGAFTKDAWYIQGYIAVRKFLEQGGDIRVLLAGRIHMDEAKILQEQAGCVLPEIPSLFR
jgi:hypothetical protein